MIRSFRSKGNLGVVRGEVRTALSREIQQRTHVKLLLLRAAADLRSLGRITANRLEALHGDRIPSVHPSTVLKTEFLDDLSMSVASLARAFNVPRTRLNDIVLGRRGITADTAYRLGRYFRLDPRFWLNLQAHYELEQLQESRSGIDAEVIPRAA